jgi:tetrapyrrole methylase family protein/MazG family protein
MPTEPARLKKGEKTVSACERNDLDRVALTADPVLSPAERLPEGLSASELASAFIDLARIVAHLRADDGCPWDREQTHLSVSRNITEEAAEAVDAIERGDLHDMTEELGDVLLQVLLQSQIAAEAGEFTLIDVINAITAKLVRRHPHVFGVDAALDAIGFSAEARAAFEEKVNAADDPEAVLALWDNIKLIEREQAGKSETSSLLDSVPNALPALMQAQDVSRKAISAGFDWASVEDVWQQVDSEVREFKAEVAGSEAASDEFGDIMFSLVNVALKDGIDAESALRGTVRRFRERWAIMEQYAQLEDRELSSYAIEEQEVFWQRAKQELTENQDQ